MHIPPSPQEVFSFLRDLETAAPALHPFAQRLVSEYGRRTDAVLALKREAVEDAVRMAQLMKAFEEKM